MNTSASRNCVRSQNTQSLSLERILQHGEANWWMPRWLETVLRMPHPESADEAAAAAPEPATG